MFLVKNIACVNFARGLIAFYSFIDKGPQSKYVYCDPVLIAYTKFAYINLYMRAIIRKLYFMDI